MQTELLFNTLPDAASRPSLAIGTGRVPLLFVRHQRARRYILRVGTDGAARVTIPRGGTTAEARRFAERNAGWVERQVRLRLAYAHNPAAWPAGTRILFRGAYAVLTVRSSANGAVVCLGDQEIFAAQASSDLRPAVERHLWQLASAELPDRVRTLAAEHGLTVRGISVRNQRARWGSCSRRGTISLNWRLVQTPDFVRDYIVLHELMHLREMNHSPRFWAAVARACPRHGEAERWLKQHRDLLR